MDIKFIIGNICVYFAVISFNTSAAIVSVDWKTAGDNLITRDTTSGLEWLDLTVTRGLSVDTVNARRSLVGDDLYGWRYASSTQLDNLLWNWGLVTSSGGAWNGAPLYTPTELNTALTDDVINTLGDVGYLYQLEKGVTFDYVEAYSSHGFLVDRFHTNYVYFASINDFDFKKTGTSAWSGNDRVALHELSHLSYAEIGNKGSFLIRDASVVPIPAAVWLFGSGLIGLIGVARRKTNA